jgi:hypothetical protein
MEHQLKNNIMENIPNPEDSWAQVELYRWQHGELPPKKDEKKLDIAVGLKNMAQAIEDGCKARDTKLMPPPFSVCAVLKYISRVIEEQNQNKIII